MSAGGIHETGHALYMQGLNPEYRGLPVGSAAGVGFHESQSLTWERMVALSRPFSDYLLPLLKERFPQQASPCGCRLCCLPAMLPVAACTGLALLSNRGPAVCTPPASRRSPANTTADDLYAALNMVQRDNMIRIRADELTYPLHVILR